MCVFAFEDVPHVLFFFFSSRRRHTRSDRDWSSDVCSSDLVCRYHPHSIDSHLQKPKESAVSTSHLPSPYARKSHLNRSLRKSFSSKVKKFQIGRAHV